MTFLHFSLVNPGTVTIETLTSEDTVLGLFNNAGALLETNDDFGRDLRSFISTSLSAGTYSIAVSKFNFFPQDGGTFSVGDISNPDFSYTLKVTFA
ncbi:MAG: DVUA0089 family protein [Nostoc sp. DedQUE12a]|nr:DVUA0089 family protein [Nostoc sp. DedQUE12a]